MFNRKAMAGFLGAILILWSATAFAAQPNGTVILSPDGNFVDIILHRMDQTTGTSIDPTDEFPSDFGYIFYESKFDGAWRRDIYVTPDTYNFANAFADGGTIILNPGTYYFSARSSWSFEGAWKYTSMDFRPFDAGANDFVLKGAESDKNGPKAKIVTDQFFHIAADPRWFDEYMYDPSSWHEVRTVSQRFENIAFDNTEYMIFREGRSTTIIGQNGKANVTFEKCQFAGGGATFHTVGSLVFEGNVLDQTRYGVHVVSSWEAFRSDPADADVLIADNIIRSMGTSIYLARNSRGVSATPKMMEIVGNDIQFFENAGIEIDGNLGNPIVKGNRIHVAAGSFGAPVYGGIALSFSDAGSIKGNVIESSASASPWAGIVVWGSSNMEVKSNKVIGTYDAPLLVVPDLSFGTGLTSDSNQFIDNNLRKSTPVGWSNLPASHILLLYGTSDNVIKGSGVAGSQVSALDLGTDNYVEGLN